VILLQVCAESHLAISCNTANAEGWLIYLRLCATCSEHECCCRAFRCPSWNPSAAAALQTPMCCPSSMMVHFRVMLYKDTCALCQIYIAANNGTSHYSLSHCLSLVKACSGRHTRQSAAACTASWQLLAVLLLVVVVNITNVYGSVCWFASDLQ
jgi:hypothetical protein